MTMAKSIQVSGALPSHKANAAFAFIQSLVNNIQDKCKQTLIRKSVNTYFILTVGKFRMKKHLKRHCLHFQ